MRWERASRVEEHTHLTNTHAHAHMHTNIHAHTIHYTHPRPHENIPIAVPRNMEAVCTPAEGSVVR